MTDKWRATGVTTIGRLSFLIILVLSGCARPQYLNPDGTQAPTPSKAAGEAGCVARFKISNACVDLKWELRPTESTFGSFIFTTIDASTGLLKDLVLESTQPLKIVLWMPSMGHGSSPVTVEQISTGVYRARDVFFNMKADWEIRFQIGADQAVYALFL